MKRSTFIKTIIPASVLTYFAGKWSYDVLKERGFFHKGIFRQPYNGKVLVLIQLDGGNDGLNTVIPIDQYANLLNARKNLLIPESKILPLHNSVITGLHPALPALQKMYNTKKVAIVQGVGCPNPDLSHFKAIDIWNSGSDSSTATHTGWLGRFLDADSNNSGQSLLSADPPAIQIGSPSISNIFQGANLNLGMAVGNTSNYYDLKIGEYEKESHTPAGDALSFYRSTVLLSKSYWERVKEAANTQKNLSTKYPLQGTNPLADQLKIAAQLIGGGLGTKVYLVNLKGFDTHIKQVDSADTTKGDHANLLAQLSEAIDAFEDDITLMNKQDKVVSMIYSEFGRRIQSNLGFGCDHGTAAPVLLFGTKVKGGLVGKNPEIATKITVSDNLMLQNDFRSVYATVLKDWFDVSDTSLKTILMGKYPTLDLLEKENNKT